MIHAELLKRVNLKNLTARAAEQDTIHRQARETIQSILKDYRTKLPKAVELAALEKELYDEAIGLGPIETLLDDADITEIMVNGATNIYIEKGAISILPILHSPIIIKS